MVYFAEKEGFPRASLGRTARQSTGLPLNRSRFAFRLALAGALCSNPSPDFAPYKKNKPPLFLRWFIWRRRRDFLALRLDALRDSPADCRFAHSRFACRLALAGALCSNPSPDFVPYKKINHRFFCDGLFGGEGGISSRFAWTRCATVHWTVALPTPASPAGSRSRERFVRIPLLTLHPIKK